MPAPPVGGVGGTGVVTVGMVTVGVEVVGLAPPPGGSAAACAAPMQAKAASTGARYPKGRKLDLFRRPAGLAVGLALKEPAPPATRSRD